MIFAFRVNIEYANDKDEVTIVDFELNDFVIFVEFKRLHRKRMELFSEINFIRKKLNAHLLYIIIGEDLLPESFLVLLSKLRGNLLLGNTFYKI